MLRICPSALSGTCKSDYCAHRKLHERIDNSQKWEDCDFDGSKTGGCPACKHLEELPETTQMKLLIKEY